MSRSQRTCCSPFPRCSPGQLHVCNNESSSNLPFLQMLQGDGPFRSRQCWASSYICRMAAQLPCILTILQVFQGPPPASRQLHKGAQGSSEVHMCTGAQMGAQGCTGVYRGAQRCTEVYRGVQGCTGVHRAAQGSLWPKTPYAYHSQGCRRMCRCELMAPELLQNPCHQAWGTYGCNQGAEGKQTRAASLRACLICSHAHRLCYSQKWCLILKRHSTPQSICLIKKVKGLI